MKFFLVDKIDRIEPGKKIMGHKALSLAEEYLADHFPAFPVLPGVLMLESLVQTAAWLLRIETGWSKSLIVLAAARNTRYGNFVAPGNILSTECELLGIKENIATFKCNGLVGEGKVAVNGKLELRMLNVSDICPAAVGADERIIAQLKKRFRLIGGSEALAAAGLPPVA